MPNNSSTSTHALLYFSTTFLHSATILSIPNCLINSVFPPVTPNSFSTCNSTGSPWVSHPPLNSIFFPCNVLNRYHKSLMTLPLRCPACGIPFIVGGPSMNLIFSGLSDAKICFSKSIDLMYAFT